MMDFVFNNAMIFKDMSNEEIDATLKFFSAKQKIFSKGELVMLSGSSTENMGLVLAGSVTIESNDMWGNRTILSNVGKGQIFGETYALLPNEPLLVDVRANENCQILFLKIGSIKKLKEQNKLWLSKFILNLLTISSHKNLILSGRGFHTSPKTIRGRVMAYLNSVSLQKNCNEFYIPFDRQQLADYLNLDRSALSKELGKMQKDDIISVKKSHFVIM